MSLTQTASEIVQSTLLQNGLPTNEQIRFEAWMMAFLRGMNQDCATNMPDRDATIVYEVSPSVPNYLPIPENCFEVIAVGTQLGRYIKPLGLASTLSFERARPTYGLVPTERDNNWYLPANGGAYGYGWGWGLSGGQGMMAFGNGGDYGDYNIDWATKTLVTSPTFAFSNIVLKYFTNCLAPSTETCVHPFFISAAEFYLMWRYHLSRNDLAMAKEFETQYKTEYGEQLIRKNRLGRPTIVKITDRIRGYKS